MNDIIQTLTQKHDAPFFFYDLDGLDRHLKEIKSILHPEVKVWYACKANPLSNILRVLNENGFGVDVASLGELTQAQAAGLKPHALIATGPAKSKKYLSKMMDAQVSTIVIESINQLKDLNEVAGSRGLKQNVLLRVQLAWDESLKSVLGGSSITPFGLGVEDWKKVNLSEYAHLEVLGLHCFQWGNILDLSKFATIWENTISQCVSLAQYLKIDMKVLDLGGGLGVNYQEGTELTFNEVHSLLLTLKEKYQLKEIWLELGRFTVANFGSYLTPIIDIKDVRGKKLMVTEGGINHIARPALVNEAFPCSTLSLSKEATETFSVHGPLCTALDFLGDHKLPRNTQVGDWLHFKKVGAYGFNESMPYFLCHDLPGEICLYKGDIIQSRTSVTSASWLS